MKNKKNNIVKKLLTLIIYTCFILLIASGCARADVAELPIPIESEVVELTARAPITIPVLMYHHISSNVTSDMVITPETFLADMEYLQQHEYTAIFFSELIEYLEGIGDLPSKPVIITFDDGYLSNYEYAFPIAKQMNQKITIAVVGWSVGRNMLINSFTPIIPHFDMAQAHEMVESGLVDIQYHTYDLHSPAGLSTGYARTVGRGMLPMEEEIFEDYRARLFEDFDIFDREVYQVLKQDCLIAVYPYGAYNTNTELIVREWGFKGSVTVEDGVRTFTTLEDLYQVPRIARTEHKMLILED